MFFHVLLGMFDFGFNEREQLRPSIPVSNHISITSISTLSNHMLFFEMFYLPPERVLTVNFPQDTSRLYSGTRHS